MMMMIRSIVRLLSVALLSLALSGSLMSAAHAKPAKPFPDNFDLPVGFLPEGIAIAPGGTAYFGSRADGDIYAASLRTGQGSVIIDGSGTQAVGLKVDNQGRLFVAGGDSGSGRVLDVRTHQVVEFYSFTNEPSFINDVVLTRDYAWFTDSFSAQIYGVPLGPGGEPGEPADVVTLPLTGDWEQADGFNANGIAVTPDQKALLIVQSATGFLFRVDPDSGSATRVDLSGTLLTAGDGLLVVGTTLYVVQNMLNQVAVIKLDPAGTSGVLVDTLTRPASPGEPNTGFDVPTTVARFGNSLYLPNARFGTEGPLTAEYWVTRIDRH
jgi:sugar lactone lactonase YvrE